MTTTTKVIFRICPENEKDLCSYGIAGTFSNWKPIILAKSNNIFSCEVDVASGKQYSYKFIKINSTDSTQKWENDPNRQVFVYSQAELTMPIQKFNTKDEQICHTFNVRLNNEIGKNLSKMYIWITNQKSIAMEKNLELGENVFSTTQILLRNQTFEYRFSTGPEKNSMENLSRKLLTNNTDTEQHIEEFNNILVIDIGVYRRLIDLESKFENKLNSHYPEVLSLRHVKSLPMSELSEINKEVSPAEVVPVEKCNMAVDLPNKIVKPSRTLLNKVEVPWFVKIENAVAASIYYSPEDLKSFCSKFKPNQIPVIIKRSDKTVDENKVIIRTRELNELVVCEKSYDNVNKYLHICGYSDTIPNLNVSIYENKFDKDNYFSFIVPVNELPEVRLYNDSSDTNLYVYRQSLFQFVSEHDVHSLNSNLIMHTELPAIEVRMATSEMLTTNSIFNFLMRLSTGSVEDFQYLIENSIHKNYAGRSATYRNVANAILSLRADVISKIMNSLIQDNNIRTGVIMNRIYQAEPELFYKILNSMENITKENCILDIGITNYMLADKRNEYITEICNKGNINSMSANSIINRSNQIGTTFLMKNNINILLPQSIYLSENVCVGNISYA